MANLWQRFKNSSGGWQSFSFVPSIFNRKNYKDLDNDVDEKNDVGEEPFDSSSEGLDQLDVGIGRRRNYKLLQWDENDKPISNTDDSVDDALWKENNRNQMIEIQAKRDTLHQGEIHHRECSQTQSNLKQSDQNQTYEKVFAQSDQTKLLNSQTCQNELNRTNRCEVNQSQPPSCHQNGNSNSNNEFNLTKTVTTVETATLTLSSAESIECYQSVAYRRPRRNSYEIALAEMRDSYDRVFGDIMDSVDKPNVIAKDITSPVWDSTVNSNKNCPETSFNGIQDSCSKKPFRRQMSSVLPENIPGAISGIRQRSYSKLGNDPDEIVDIPLNDENRSGEWQNSFPVPSSQKKKRKRSKKAWKKTMKGVRVAWKWFKRSFIGFGSSYNYGIPLNVAMYGGSRRDGRRKFYDYR